MVLQYYVSCFFKKKTLIKIRFKMSMQHFARLELKPGIVLKKSRFFQSFCDKFVNNSKLYD